MLPMPVTSNDTSLGATVRTLRVEAGLRVEDLAYKTRLASKTILRIETGMDAKVSTISRIAEGLGLAAWELLRQAQISVEAKAS